MHVLLPRMLIHYRDFHCEWSELLVTTASYKVIRIIGGHHSKSQIQETVGVFVLKFIEYLVLGVPFNFNAQYSLVLWKKITASMLLGEIV